MAAFRPSFCIESRPGLTLQVQFKKPAGPMMMMMARLSRPLHIYRTLELYERMRRCQVRAPAPDLSNITTWPEFNKSTDMVAFTSSLCIEPCPGWAVSVPWTRPVALTHRLSPPFRLPTYILIITLIIAHSLCVSPSIPPSPPPIGPQPHFFQSQDPTCMDWLPPGVGVRTYALRRASSSWRS